MSATMPIPAQDGHGLEPTLPFADNQDAANRSESTVTMQDSPEAPQTTKRARKPYVPLTYSCGGCDSRWSGVNRAHCSGEKSASLTLFPVRDGDARFLAERYPHLHERPVDGGGVPGKLLADLVGAPSARVQARRLRPPSNVRVFEMVVLNRGWSKVLWSVIGPNQIDVMNLILGGDESVEDTVLVGFDLLVRPNIPTQDDVPMVPKIPTRFSFGHLLAGGKIPRGESVSEIPTRTTKPKTISTGNGQTAGLAGSGEHDLILQVTALCHRTWTGTTMFDQHRRDVRGVGTCIDPETIPGQVFRDGLWRSAKERPDGTWTRDT